METNLCNAVVIAENPEMYFIVEGNRLHAVEELVSELKMEESKDEIVLPKMRDALTAISKFAQGKVYDHFIDEEKNISLKPTEREQIIEKILNIYSHLPHHDKIHLSSLVHHKQI